MEKMALDFAMIQRIQFEYNDSRSHCIVTQRTNDIIIWLESNGNREKKTIEQQLFVPFVVLQEKCCSPLKAVNPLWLTAAAAVLLHGHFF